MPLEIYRYFVSCERQEKGVFYNDIYQRKNQTSRYGTTTSFKSGGNNLTCMLNVYNIDSQVKKNKKIQLSNPKLIFFKAFLDNSHLALQEITCDFYVKNSSQEI